MSNLSTNPAGRPASDSSDTIAMLLEIIFGFFGILGMGWLYAGNFPIAILVFIGFLIVVFIEFFVMTITVGIAACIIIPVNLAVAVISGLRARDYVRNSGAQGSILYVIIGIFLGAIIICGGIFMFFGGLSFLEGFFS